MVKLSKETHLEMFTKMERIREFDSRINKLVRRGFVQGYTRWTKHGENDDVPHDDNGTKDMEVENPFDELAGAP